jgi:type II secretory pathway pseudopilin PulG
VVDPEPTNRQMDGIRVATLAVLAVDTLVVILLASFLLTSVQSQREVNECYQRQVTEVTAYLGVAAQAARTDRQAQRELLSTRPGSPDDGRAALDRYLAQLDEADRTRSTNPIPQQRCAR